MTAYASVPSALAATVVCPSCHATLAHVADGARCEPCDVTYASDRTCVDFVGSERDTPTGFAPAMMHTPFLARVYERFWRPCFMGMLSRGRPDFEREYALIRAALQAAEGQTLVDLSCGPGLMGRRLASDRAYPWVVGIDLSAAMLSRCHAYSERERVENFPLLRADVGALPLADASVAGVHAGAALHLWPDVPGALAEVGRVLSPGGVLVATTLVYSSQRLVRRVESAFGAATQTRFFRRSELERGLREAGLRDVKLRRWRSLAMVTGIK